MLHPLKQYLFKNCKF